ncbi:hypothetical protein ACWPM1_13380 [Tsuneonella sp. HG249]
MTAVLLTAFYAVMVSSLAFAWFRGGGAERIAVLLLLAFFAFRVAVHPLMPVRFTGLDPLALTQDLIGFVGFVWIGLRARRYWPLIAAALQLLSLSAHFARVLHLPVDPWAYSVLKSVPTLLVYIVLAIGTANYRRRVRAKRHLKSSPTLFGQGTEPSWRRPSLDSVPPEARRSSSHSTTAKDATRRAFSAKEPTEESNSTTAI